MRVQVRQLRVVGERLVRREISLARHPGPGGQGISVRVIRRYVVVVVGRVPLGYLRGGDAVQHGFVAMAVRIAVGGLPVVVLRRCDVVQYGEVGVRVAGLPAAASAAGIPRLDALRGDGLQDGEVAVRVVVGVRRIPVRHLGAGDAVQDRDVAVRMAGGSASAAALFERGHAAVQVPSQGGRQDPAGLRAVVCRPGAADGIQAVVGRRAAASGCCAVGHDVAGGRDAAGDGKRVQGVDARDGIVFRRRSE